MSKLVNMVMRIAFWGALGAVVAGVGMVAVQAFRGGALGSAWSSPEVLSVAGIGAVVGGVIGFFRRN